MLKVQEKSKPETAIWLDQADVLITNDESGNFRFKSAGDQKVAIKIHADSERIYLSDMTFNESIFLNDQLIPAGSKRTLKHGDQIQIGSSFFEIVNPRAAVNKLQSTEKDTLVRDGVWRLKAIGNWLDGQVFKIQGKSVIGRDNTCEITIPGSHLSRRHAEFIPTENGLAMRDLDSANGSYVNGKRLKEAKLKDGDEVRLDILTFRVVAPERKVVDPDRKDVTQPNPNQEKSGKVDTDPNRNWVTKPTSPGNAAHDPHDIILAEHIRNKKIMYGVFTALVIVILAVLFSL